MSRAQLGSAVAGTWRLGSWTVTYDDGTVRTPFGDQPAGLLVYGADGGMAVCIHDPGGSRARASFAYAGRYHDRDGALVHEIVSSTVHSLVGTRQVREAELSDRTLTLSVRDPEKARTDRIIWHKATPA